MRTPPRKRSYNQTEEALNSAEAKQLVAEQEDVARATAESIMYLCASNSEEAGRRVELVWRQIHAWMVSFKKAQKMFGEKLKELVDGGELAKGTIISPNTQVAELERKILQV